MPDTPPPIQPRFLKCPQAAAYLGVSATTFALEVRAGIWPPAMRRGDKQSALTWDRRLLDRAADRLAGLSAADAPGADIAAAEAAAMEATLRGTPSKDRNKNRHPKAA